MSAGREPAELFSPGVFIRAELDARGWTERDLAIAIGGDVPFIQLCWEFYLACVDTDDILFGAADARDLETALGASAEFWMNLQASWRAWRWPEHGAASDLDS